jgi:hypothetical protein
LLQGNEAPKINHIENAFWFSFINLVCSRSVYDDK